MNKQITGILLGTVILLCAGAWWYEYDNAAARGERAFQRLGCGGCHFSGAGPNLTHIARKEDPKLLQRFIANPPEIYRERGMKSLNEGYMLMPDMHASPQDARDIVAYLRDLDRRAK